MKPEAQVSREIRDFLRTIGWSVWSTEQGFRAERGGTRTTPGIPDLITAGMGMTLLIEVKGPRGHLSPAQRDFGARWKENGGRWICARSSAEVFDYLVALGVVQEVSE